MNKNRLTELLSMPFDVLLNDKELQTEITSFYKEIYGVKVCSSCKDKFKSHYEKLMNDGFDKLEQDEEITPSIMFKLRPDINANHIYFGDGFILKPNNLDDDIVIEFLKQNPNRISLFKDYPENWKQLLTQNNDDENVGE